MPRLGIEVSQNFGSTRFGEPVGPSGRSVRQIRAAAGVNKPRWPFFLTNQVFLKFLLRFAIIAAFALSVAIWRLHHFTH